MEPLEATPLEATTVQDWKKATRTEFEGHHLKVTSGNIALVRKVTLDQFLTSGWVPNPLIPFLEDVMKQGRARKSGPAELDTVEKVRAMKSLVDRVVVECTLQPVVQPLPRCVTCNAWVDDDIHHGVDLRITEDQKMIAHEYDPASRDEELLYVDEVDWDDKFDVYEFALSEASAVNEFREEQGTDVEPVPNRKNVQRKTKQTARRK